MQTIKELYKAGNGPSSSHTIGPVRASQEIIKLFPKADRIDVILYGSLALTGAGHKTDVAIKSVFKDIECKIKFDIKNNKIEHPNTFDYFIYQNNKLIGQKRYFSIGGGTFITKGQKPFKNIYNQKSFDEIKKYCLKNKMSLPQYVISNEEKDFYNFLDQIYAIMQVSIKNGLKSTGYISNKINYIKQAKQIFENKPLNETDIDKRIRVVSSYAIAVNEENASGGVVVTTPTCGAAGVLPAVLYYLQSELQLKQEKIIEALCVAGIIGNILKKYGSISGAEGGCQAEIGSACSMAAAAASYLLYNASIDEMEISARMAMEHFLGLTCDPIDGHVIIPCIERNAIAAVKALDVAVFAHLSKNINQNISFDQIVSTMKKTGQDLKSQYRETSMGGLAVFAKNALKIK